MEPFEISLKIRHKHDLAVWIIPHKNTQSENNTDSDASQIQISRHKNCYLFTWLHYLEVKHFSKCFILTKSTVGFLPKVVTVIINFKSDYTYLPFTVFFLINLVCWFVCFPSCLPGYIGANCATTDKSAGDGPTSKSRFWSLLYSIQ